MSEVADKQVEWMLEHFDDGVDHYRSEARRDSLEHAGREAREREAAALNGQRLQSSEGTLLAEALDPSDAARCADFVERMRAREPGFPGSKLLENQVDYESAVKGFVRRAMGKDRLEPFSIRGYHIGMVTMPGGGPRVYDGSSQKVFLCEDGRLRVYAVSNVYPAYRDDDSKRYELSDLPIDPNTGRVVEVRFAHSDPSSDSWGSPAVHDSVTDMLKYAISDAQRAEASIA